MIILLAFEVRRLGGFDANDQLTTLGTGLSDVSLERKKERERDRERER